MNFAFYSINWLLMILMHIALGWTITKKRMARWGLFVVGTVTFSLSQVAHIPFNLTLFGSLKEWLGSISSQLSLVIEAVLAGLSEGVFEETARLVSFRIWAKDARTWGTSLMVDAGRAMVRHYVRGH